MLNCAFCSNSKSEKYLYTQCNHFVCINCAALRVRQGLRCCNIMTKLSQEIKNQLKIKKQVIINNLQNQYEYQKTDFNEIDFIEVQDNLRNSLEQNLRQKYKYKQINLQYSNGFDSNQNLQKILKQTPINQFYKNPLILQNQNYQIPVSTPIKEVINLQNSQKFQDKKQKNYKTYENKSHFSSNRFSKSQFLPILQNKIQIVRNQFKIFYEQLEKREATIIYQMKVYFQEYMKLIQQQSLLNQHTKFNKLLEQERTTVFLNQFVEKWNLKQIKKSFYLIQKIQQSNDEKQVLRQNNVNKLKEPLFRENQNQYRRKQNLGKFSKNMTQFKIKEAKQNQEMQWHKMNNFLTNQQHIRLSQNIQQSPKNCQTGRNLDKIYKKLQQSRTKLQERIQKHNWFMSDRFNNLSKAC